MGAAVYLSPRTAGDISDDRLTQSLAILSSGRQTSWEEYAMMGIETHEVGHEPRPKHILVINDTVAILELFTALLEDEGFRVTTDGFSVEMGEMLERVKAEQPDLIILDLVVLDEGKGWQFLQLLKMNRTTRDIPVILCTAAAKLVEELQVHLDEMRVGVVLKPFDIDHLLLVIRRVWEAHGRVTADASSDAGRRA
jgi:CheY-like chemotaxis protein